MKFRVTGENVNTAARTVMEIEAGSKAEAERKARAAGMNVHHASAISAEEVVEERGSRPRATGFHPVIKLGIFLALAVAAYLFLWPKLQPMLRR